MLTRQHKAARHATRRHRKMERNPQQRHRPDSDVVGNTILFVMLTVILLVLALVMNGAIRDACYKLRDALP